MHNNIRSSMRVFFISYKKYLIFPFAILGTIYYKERMYQVSYEQF